MTTAESGGPRVAVVGVGHFGRHHARVLSTLPGVRLETVVDIDLARAQATAAEVGTAFAGDASSLDGRVDAVTVAVPTARSTWMGALISRHICVNGSETRSDSGKATRSSSTRPTSCARPAFEAASPRRTCI